VTTRRRLASPRSLAVPGAAAVLAAVLGAASLVAGPPGAAAGTFVKEPTATGTGGAVSSVDADATRVGLEVLRAGGTAADAAVAPAAALGVTEPYSAGVGGGGFLVYYDAGSGQVQTIDGRETAPRAMTSTSFTENGVPIPFNDAVTSGLSVGVPGTPATWTRALQRWGTMSLSEVLAGPTRLARDGFVVDQTFRDQTAANAARFAHFTSTSKLFLPGGAPPAVGSTFTNRDLARTYERLGRDGDRWLYSGALGAQVVETVKNPPLVEGSTYVARPGLMEKGDLRAYEAVDRAPTHVGYRGLDVFGMAPPSSGGSTVGEALNILERSDLSAMDGTQALHHYLEASALAFADRNAYVGDPAEVDVPLDGLLSDDFAAERACRIDPAAAAAKPVPAGVVDGSYDTDCDGTDDTTATGGDQEGLSTTHLTVADQWGNVAAYTLTIEQTGGSGIVVPGRGFLLNNELTDFNFTPTVPGDPNLPAPGKRPRSSMAPTILLDDGRPVLAVGSPGGSTIITTVLQVLLNRLDLGMTLPAAVAAPRASQRNTAAVQAEQAFDRTGLAALGHTFVAPPAPGEIGAATGIEIGSDGGLTAVAEPVRRGGGSAGVVDPD
jgi:gamma-glutamyltranspeptidase/glutathione hydrolase